MHGRHPWAHYGWLDTQTRHSCDHLCSLRCVLGSHAGAVLHVALLRQAKGRQWHRVEGDGLQGTWCGGHRSGARRLQSGCACDQEGVEERATVTAARGPCRPGIASLSSSEAPLSMVDTQTPDPFPRPAPLSVPWRFGRLGRSVAVATGLAAKRARPRGAGSFPGTSTGRLADGWAWRSIRRPSRECGW